MWQEECMEKVYMDFLSWENEQLFFFLLFSWWASEAGAAGVMLQVIEDDCTVVLQTNQGCKLQLTVSQVVRIS